MPEDNLVDRARTLGGDHAEAQQMGKLHHRLYSGRDVARALGVVDQLDGDQYVALREAYDDGWSFFW
ncbi:hypothetical protein JNB62_05275 [Microbacterium jejuense]|uniref:Uncharacterized protein n=1 Tax=Microbacterium jejuense TaxID=1263637 RepID=A0ABS7HLC8_9MICO|nr:hypothetical protein [Microbacterium jejuense]MBW9093086.1 hypothetical protein [Microbacterium jejuense]